MFPPNRRSSTRRPRAPRSWARTTRSRASTTTDATFFVLGDLSADNAEHVGTFQYLGQVDRNQLQADNTAVTNAWIAIYDAIARVNLILQKVPNVTGLTDTEKNQILGEAHFLRALHYHNLVKFWGDVPMPLEPLDSPAEAAQLTRTPKADVYTQILADLTQAEQLMTTAKQARQASLGAVRALRARVMLYQENYQGALDAANAVQAMGYALAPQFENLFTDEGTDTPEDIFRVSFTAVEFNEMGYYYLFDGRWEVAPTADLYNGLLRHGPAARRSRSARMAATTRARSTRRRSVPKTST